jgi:hypothetical protein
VDRLREDKKMNYKNFTFTDNSYTITHIREKYTRTGNGKSWKKAPDDVKTETITAQQYENWITSIPFFNGFCGGKCRADLGYTKAGYIPVKIITTSPDAAIKYNDYFNFD